MLGYCSISLVYNQCNGYHGELRCALGLVIKSDVRKQTYFYIIPRGSILFHTMRLEAVFLCTMPRTRTRTTLFLSLNNLELQRIDAYRVYLVTQV